MSEFVAQAVAIFNGRNGVGLISIGVGLPGDKVLSVMQVGGDQVPNSFGSFIPSAGSIVQVVGSDLSGNQFVALLGRAPD